MGLITKELPVKLQFYRLFKTEAAAILERLTGELLLLKPTGIAPVFYLHPHK